MQTTLDESLLFRRAWSGDVGAHENIYRREPGRVFAVCLRLVKDRVLTDDIADKHISVEAGSVSIRNDLDGPLSHVIVMDVVET